MAQIPWGQQFRSALQTRLAKGREVTSLPQPKGMNFGAGSSGRKGSPSRSLSYATNVQFNGNLMVGKT